MTMNDNLRSTMVPECHQGRSTERDEGPGSGDMEPRIQMAQQAVAQLSYGQVVGRDLHRDTDSVSRLTGLEGTRREAAILQTQAREQ